MKCLSLSTTFLMISSASILIALCLAGASLEKSVKWNFYNNDIDYGSSGGGIFHINAYQTLWTSYDAYNPHITDSLQVFNLLKDDSWRLLPRLLILSTLGLGAISLCILLIASLVPFLKRRPIVLNGCRIASSVLSVCAGTILAFTLQYFKNHYQSILALNFDEPFSGYPPKDNISTGFYIAAIACTFYFLSAIINVANVVILIKAGNTTVKPSEQGSE